MAGTTFPDPEASLAGQLRQLFFPREVVDGFMPEQAAVSIESGLAVLMGRGYQECLRDIIDQVDRLEDERPALSEEARAEIAELLAESRRLGDEAREHIDALRNRR